MPTPSYGFFKTGAIEKEVFFKLKELATAHHLTQRGMVMLGVLAIVKLGSTDPAAVDALAEQVRTDYHGGA